jgi:hypothetical protein
LPPDFPVDPRYQDMDDTERAYFDWKYLNKINCWHRADYESNAMWRLYAEESKGIAICSTPARMKEAIKPYYLHNPDYPEILWAGNIRYHDFLKVRLRPASHQRYFTKHQAFACEKEFRLMISMMEAHEFGVDVVREGIDVSVDLDPLIEKIMLGPELTKEDQATIIEVGRKQGFGERAAFANLVSWAHLDSSSPMNS